MFTGAHFITAPQDEGRDPVFLPVTGPIYYTCRNNVDLRDGREALFLGLISSFFILAFEKTESVKKKSYIFFFLSLLYFQR